MSKAFLTDDRVVHQYVVSSFARLFFFTSSGYDLLLL